MLLSLMQQALVFSKTDRPLFVFALLYCSLANCCMSLEKSTPTKVSSPTTQASCPGRSTYISPAVSSCSVPLSWTTCIWPETTYPVCCTWQLGVWAIGFTASDHFHPGSN